MKETLCWRCKNYNKCSWSVGEPVEGWDATPTVIQNEIPIESFCVIKCPQYEPDDKQQVTLSHVAKILNKCESTLKKCIYRKGNEYVKGLAYEKGYILHIYKHKKRRVYCLEKRR